MVRRKNTVRSSAPSENSSTVNTDAPVSPQKKRKLETATVAYADGQQIVMTKGMFKTMRRLQLSTGLLIPKLPFSRIVREIIMDLYPNSDGMRIQIDALKALQESCELFLTQYFEDSYLCTLHAKRTTLNVRDMQLARRIRGRQDVINH